MLTAEQIRAANQQRRTQVQEVDVPEWGGKVYVRRLSADDRDALAAASKAHEQTGQPLRGWVAALCLSDDKGTPMFYAPQHSEELGAMDGAAIERIVNAAFEFNGLTEKAIADLEKNSATTPTP